MTTREYLKARAMRINSRVWPIPFVVLGFALWARPGSWLNILVLIAVASCFAAYLTYMRRTPCLRCSAPLRNLALQWGSKSLPAPRCPHCGLNIDDQVADPISIEDVAKGSDKL